MGPIQPPV